MCICLHTPVITAKHHPAGLSSPHSADCIIEPDIFILIWADIPSSGGSILLSHFPVRICVCVYSVGVCVRAHHVYTSLLACLLGGLLLIRLYEVCACVLDHACISAVLCVSVSRVILKPYSPPIMHMIM